MAKPVIVTNLSTCVEMVFVGITPEQAVVAAWEQQEHNNYNTWEYADSKAPIVRGKHGVAAGDWCAVVKP